MSKIPFEKMNPFKEKACQNLILGEYQSHVEKRLKSWMEMSFSRRLWARDHTLWFPGPVPEITERLGWLVLPETMHDKLDELISFAEEVKDEGIGHVILLGMGGSSMAPEVFQKTFGSAPDYPELIVLDSTHPAAVHSIEDKINLHHTIFLVSSKSGTTLETLSLFRYFWKQVSLVNDNPGQYFVAITDHETPLMHLAQKRNFRQIFLSSPDVGGRYSAFTVFGLVPAALIGMDIQELLARARGAAESNKFSVLEEKAPGFVLGAALGELVKKRDKLTLLASASLRSFPDWLEQLIAESTGKDGKGIVPVVNEPLAQIDVYGEDRVFVYLSLDGEKDEEMEDRLKKLEDAGHPIILNRIAEKADLGQEIFHWEIAVASAGSMLGIHPFNQPDVQLAKDLARTAMEDRREREGQRESDRETLSIDERNVLAEALRNWSNRSKLGDYIALQAYLPPESEITGALQRIRFDILKHTRLATTMGYGPRFLHSTGQLHKGGPNNGLFLQIIDEPLLDLPIPETDYSFRSLIQAQSLGDYQALKQRGRRVLRINLKSDVLGGLVRLTEGIQATFN